MLITGSFEGDAVPLEVDASCRTAAALKKQILRELPQLADDTAFDVTFQGHVLDDAAVCGLEGGCTVAIAASRSAKARSELRRQGREVNEGELFRAAALGDVAVCDLLLDAGVSADCHNANLAERGFGAVVQTVLEHAASANRSKVCALLLKRGCKKGLAMWSALGDVETCKAFLDGGCSAEDDRAGRTLLDAAVQDANVDVAALLLKRGANPSGTSDDTDTPLQYSIHNDNDAMCRVLIEGGCDVEECGDDSAPIVVAAQRNNVAVCALLLEHGARLSSRSDESGETPLEIAERNEFSELCTLFKNKRVKRA